MSDRAFLDTNVLVYAFDRRDSAKHERAKAIMSAGVFVISTQVLGEFYAVATRKLQKWLSQERAAAVVTDLSRVPVVSIDSQLVRSAIEVSRSAQISYWDGLIVSAARAGGCDRLLSEDLSHGQTIDSVLIENPFR